MKENKKHHTAKSSRTVGKILWLNRIICPDKNHDFSRSKQLIGQQKNGHDLQGKKGTWTATVCWFRPPTSGRWPDRRHEFWSASFHVFFPFGFVPWFSNMRNPCYIMLCFFGNFSWFLAPDWNRGRMGKHWCLQFRIVSWSATLDDTWQDQMQQWVS